MCFIPQVISRLYIIHISGHIHKAKSVYPFESRISLLLCLILVQNLLQEWISFHVSFSVFPFRKIPKDFMEVFQWNVMDYCSCSKAPSLGYNLGIEGKWAPSLGYNLGTERKWAPSLGCGQWADDNNY